MVFISPRKLYLSFHFETYYFTIDEPKWKEIFNYSEVFTSFLFLLFLMPLNFVLLHWSHELLKKKKREPHTYFLVLGVLYRYLPYSKEDEAGNY